MQDAKREPKIISREEMSLLHQEFARKVAESGLTEQDTKIATKKAVSDVRRSRHSVKVSGGGQSILSQTAL